MSSKVTGWVWDLDLACQPKLLLLWLANRATDSGVCFPTKRELGRRTGLSERMVRYHLECLARDHDEHGQASVPLLTIIERRVAGDRNTSNVYVIRVPWASLEVVRAELDELKHVPSSALEGVGTTGCIQGGDHALHPVGTTGCTQVGTTGCTENRSRSDDHPDNPPIPPVATQQQPGGRGCGEERGDAYQAAPRLHPDEPLGEEARDLVVAFYRGLGADSTALTVTMRRRDLAIARQMVDAGASAAEAESYARETSQLAGRIAPIDLRSFERERLGWLARRRGAEQTRARFIDRTGQPPSWQLPVPEIRAQPLHRDEDESLARARRLPERTAGPVAAASLADTLRVVLLGHTA